MSDMTLEADIRDLRTVLSIALGRIQKLEEQVASLQMAAPKGIEHPTAPAKTDAP